MENILITGASRGIGRAIALALGSNKNFLILTGRDQRALAETGRMVKENGGSAKTIVKDLSAPAQIDELISEIGSVKINHLINNAGMAVVKPFEDLTLDDWHKTFAVNVTAPFLLTQKLIGNMSAGSSIVNILSVASKTGFADWSSYCMSKFALDGFAKSIRGELSERGIRVINIYPGAIDTDIWNDVPGDWPRDKMMSADEVAKSVKFAMDAPANVVLEDITISNV